VGTTAFSGGGVTVWRCFSLNCKLDVYVFVGTLTGQKYRDQILCPLVVPHFDDHPLASRPILMDDNVRPHRFHSCVSRSPYADATINWIQQKITFILPVQSLPPSDIPSHMVTCLAVVWRIVISGRFIGLLARNLALLRHLLVGMVRGGVSYRQPAKRFEVSHWVIVRLKQRVHQTGSVNTTKGQEGL
jgi:hypothetical protein